MSGSEREKLSRLQEILAGYRSVVIAFSGGVDSTFLLRVAVGVPGLRTLALTTDSPTTTAAETEEAGRLAEALGADHVVASVDELDTPGYRENPANRCYLCKQNLYPLCLAEAERRGFARVADGVNVDDLGDWRPGLVAAGELGVEHPLVDAGLTKDEIRALSRSFGLDTADKPASPCLSSRFPYGTEITHARLRQVEDGEAVLHALGFAECRVRHLGDAARVEVPGADLARLHSEETATAVRSALSRIGFSRIDLSRVPLRSGSLNDALRNPQ